MHFYGYKLHAVCSINGVFQSIDLSSASVHDIHYLKDIREQLSDCALLGDKGYLSSEIQFDLFNCAGQQHFYPIKAWSGENAFKNLQKSDERKRQLCSQLGIRLIEIDYTETLILEYFFSKLLLQKYAGLCRK